ncbi:hypothetical protein CYMTET_23474 [Cymbomonas tetramitiformis]|uniref:Uncharacterized protein n=1 Tax=Cymbomonas tetramitiformis TaxID=36881 RepID=A0AAE0FY39_9CHLO|nr:hypothetical protein CYMTET_23474 [Cymbomonas tetramitiformis]
MIPETAMSPWVVPNSVKSPVRSSAPSAVTKSAEVEVAVLGNETSHARLVLPPTIEVMATSDVETPAAEETCREWDEVKELWKSSSSKAEMDNVEKLDEKDTTSTTSPPEEEVAVKVGEVVGQTGGCSWGHGRWCVGWRLKSGGCWGRSGREVGAADGVLVGSRVLGDDVGAAVGARGGAVGAFVGDTVGEDVVGGMVVGVPVGATVGEVGEAVGEVDGEAVGEVVGEVLGEAVGVIVGEVVGGWLTTVPLRTVVPTENPHIVIAQTLPVQLFSAVKEKARAEVPEGTLVDWIVMLVVVFSKAWMLMHVVDGSPVK